MCELKFTDHVLFHVYLQCINYKVNLVNNIKNANIAFLIKNIIPNRDILSKLVSFFLVFS